MQYFVYYANNYRIVNFDQALLKKNQGSPPITSPLSIPPLTIFVKIIHKRADKEGIIFCKTKFFGPPCMRKYFIENSKTFGLSK